MADAIIDGQNRRMSLETEEISSEVTDGNGASDMPVGDSAMVAEAVAESNVASDETEESQ